MLPLWHLPRELVRLSGKFDGWFGELAINLIQPYLTAQILKTTTDMPFDATSLAWIYDRYARRLGAHVLVLRL